MSDLKSGSSQESSSKIKTPTKRTPSKRMSTIERAQLESVEVIKSMGGSLDVEGGRRTRSSVRGVSTPATPPPAKKSRQSSSSTPRRGRPKKLLINEDDEDKDTNSIEEVMKTTEKVNDDTIKDEITVVKPDNEVTTGKKSNTLEDATDTENDNASSKNIEDTISSTLPLTEEITEKCEVDASSELETIDKNHIEEKQTEFLSTPVVVVTAPTPEKQQSTKNVPEIKLDPVEPMEVDISIQLDENDVHNSDDANTNNVTTVKEPTTPTTNSCTLSTANETVIENNVVNNKEDVQIDNTNKIENAADEIISNKSVVVESNNIVNEKINIETAATIPQNDNKINSIVENDKEQEQSLNENKIIAESDEKKENNSCEPKISTSPTSDGITRPQTCN